MEDMTKTASVLCRGLRSYTVLKENICKCDLALRNVDQLEYMVKVGGVTAYIMYQILCV